MPDWHETCGRLGWSTARGGVLVPVGARRHRVQVRPEAGGLLLVGPVPLLPPKQVEALVPRLLQRNASSGLAGWHLDEDGQPVVTARVRTGDEKALVLALREVAALADHLELHLADEDLL
jgi:hypothetical protein